MSDEMEPDDMVELDHQVRAALRSAVAVDAAARARAVAAALDAVGGDTAVVPFTAAPSRRRIRVASSLSAAAAVVVVVSIGVITSRSGGDEAATMMEASIEATDNDRVEEPAAGADDQYGIAEESMSVMASDENDAADKAYSATAEEPANEEPAAEPLITSSYLGDDMPILATTTELVELIDLLAERVATGDAEPPDTSCVMIGGGAVGRATYDGVNVVLFRDLAMGTYTALALDDCRTVVQTTVTP